MLHIVGGVYYESCVHPNSSEILGSGGRAASAIAGMHGEATLHTFLDQYGLESMKPRAAYSSFELDYKPIENGGRFSYLHGLSKPSVYMPSLNVKPLKIKQDHIIRFGMLESTGIIDAEYAVFDPQNVRSPEDFHSNFSKAKHLALVLNRFEAIKLANLSESATLEEMTREIASRNNADIVIIKNGALGATIFDGDNITNIPAYKTNRVSKIGSGDCFVAYFGYFWMEKKYSAIEAARMASKATAYYCETKGFPSTKRLNEFQPVEIRPSVKFINGYQPRVYLAGPFFNLSQLWLVNQAKNNLIAMGLNVFSPYHEIGRGTAEEVVEKDLQGIKNCDLVFAIGDGLDAGTIYEVGYARSFGKPVIFYSENESDEDKKMMEGSSCILCDDYVTAIYKTFWAASEID